MDELVGVSAGADRERDAAGGGRSGAALGGEGLLPDPLGGGGVELDEACAGHLPLLFARAHTQRNSSERERESDCGGSEVGEEYEGVLKM